MSRSRKAYYMFQQLFYIVIILNSVRFILLFCPMENYKYIMGSFGILFYFCVFYILCFMFCILCFNVCVLTNIEQNKHY